MTLYEKLQNIQNELEEALNSKNNELSLPSQRDLRTAIKLIDTAKRDTIDGQKVELSSMFDE